MFTVTSSPSVKVIRNLFTAKLSVFPYCAKQLAASSSGAVEARHISSGGFKNNNSYTYLL
jgi:hypothetical protein